MKALTGAVLALLTIVLVFFGFAPRASSRADAQQSSQAVYAQPAPTDVVQPQAGTLTAGGAQVVPVSAAPQPDAGQQPVLVNCGPGTQTLVRPVWMNGQQVSQVECVPAASGVVYASQVAQPVAYAAPVYDARMTRTRQARSYDYAPAPRRVTHPRRSWQKTALVIGGTTATGAGIGALIGGKKGALIGAAIGGGASTIYEAGKRR